MALPEWNSCGLETWHYLFVLYNPPSFFPLPLLFGISVCTGWGWGTECFCGTVTASFGLQWEQQAHTGDERSSGCIVPAGGALLSREMSQSFLEFGIQPTPLPWWLWSITLVFSVTGLEAGGGATFKAVQRDVLPRQASTHQELPGSSLSHFMSTQLCQSVILYAAQGFVTVPCKFSQLAKISATCRSLPHCYQLPRGWTVSARGQSQRWLDRLAVEQTGAVWTGYWKMSLHTRECTERQLLV